MNNATLVYIKTQLKLLTICIHCLNVQSVRRLIFGTNMNQWNKLIDINCPECGAIIQVSEVEAENEEEITCPNCDEPIEDNSDMGSIWDDDFNPEWKIKK